jgi:hypothetical protein
MEAQVNKNWAKVLVKQTLASFKEVAETLVSKVIWRLNIISKNANKSH